MVDAIWPNPAFVFHAVSYVGGSFGREMVMWSFPKWTVQGIMMKADDGFENVVESYRLQVQAMTPDITEWVGYMVGQVWSWVDSSSVDGYIQRL